MKNLFIILVINTLILSMFLSCKKLDIKPEQQKFNDSLNFNVIIKSITVANNQLVINTFGKAKTDLDLKASVQILDFDNVSERKARYPSKSPIFSSYGDDKVEGKDFIGKYKNEALFTSKKFTDGDTIYLRSRLVTDQNNFYSNIVKLYIKNNKVNIIDNGGVNLSNTGVPKFTIFSYKVVNDDNNNKVVNQGENITMKILLKNIGTNLGYDIKVEFSDSSSLISNLTPNYQFQGAWNQNDSNSVNISFDVTSSIKKDTIIPIFVKISDKNGNSTSESFNVTVATTKIDATYSSNKITSDDNSNGIANNGESVRYSVYFNNVFTSLTSTISTTSTYATITQTGIEEFYSLSGGGVDSTSFTLDINNNTPNGTVIPIVITLTDKDGIKTTQTFNITVIKGTITATYTSNKITSDDNSNGVANNGETVKYSVYFNNVYTSLTSTISTTSSYATITQTGIEEFYSLNGGGVDSTSFTLDINTNTPNGTVIPIVITLTDKNGNTTTQNFNLTVVTLLPNLVVDSYNFCYGCNYISPMPTYIPIKAGFNDYLYFKVKNTGDILTKYPQFKNVTSNSSNFQLINIGGLNSNIQPNSSSEASWRISVNSNTPIGTIINISFQIIDDNGNAWNKVLAFKVN